MDGVYSRREPFRARVVERRTQARRIELGEVMRHHWAGLKTGGYVLPAATYYWPTRVLWLDTHCQRPARFTNTSTKR